MPTTIRTVLDRFDAALAKRLPTNLYFAISDVIRPLIHKRRRGGMKRRVRKDGRTFCVEWENGTSFHFISPYRYQRYLWPNGLGTIAETMLDKYQDREVTITKDSVVVEVGANVGEFTCAAAKIARRVIAFEPDPIVFEALEKNVRTLSNIQIERAGLGEADGQMTFYLSSEDADSSIIEPPRWSSSIEVKVRSLAAYLREHEIERVDLLKVEAEGYEPEVLRGGGAELRRVHAVSVDCGPERYGETTFAECEDVLHRSGFRTWRRTNDGQSVLFGLRQY